MYNYLGNTIFLVFATFALKRADTDKKEIITPSAVVSIDQNFKRTLS